MAAPTNSTTYHFPPIPTPPPSNNDMSTANARSPPDNGHLPLPAPSLFPTYITTCVILLVVAALTVGLKFAFTWKARGRLGKDDGMIALGLATLVATGIMGAEAYNHGLGSPTVMIDGKYPSWRRFWWEYLYYAIWEANSYSRRHGLMTRFSVEYTPLCFSKLAFFLMYTRTFRGKKMKYALWTSMIIFTALTILFITGTQLMSDGIKQSQYEAIKALRYHVQFRYLHYAWGTCDILADLWICILPLIGLRVLRIGFKKRLAYTAKFAVPAITFVISMIRIYELNLVMSRDIMTDHTWDPSLAETVPFLWAFIQAAAAVIITTLPALTLRFSVWYNLRRRAKADPEHRLSDQPTIQSEDPSKASTSEPALTAASLATSASELLSSSASRRSKAERILGHRFKRSKEPDEYTEEMQDYEPLGDITVTRTVNVTSTMDPEEGFRLMYRKYCGVAGGR